MSELNCHCKVTLQRKGRLFFFFVFSNWICIKAFKVINTKRLWYRALFKFAGNKIFRLLLPEPNTCSTTQHRTRSVIKQEVKEEICESIGKGNVTSDHVKGP